MTNPEQTLKAVFGKALEQYVQSENFNEMMTKHMAAAFSDSFKETLDGWNAPAKKIIEEKMKEMIIPTIEKYDFNRFQTKLTAALDEMAKMNLGPMGKIGMRFRESIKPIPEYLKMSDFFTMYCDVYAKEMDVEDVEVNFDDRPTYESADVQYEFMEDEHHYGSHINGTLDIYINEHPSKDENVRKNEETKHSLKFRLWKPDMEKSDGYLSNSYKEDCEKAGARVGEMWYVSSIENPFMYAGLSQTEATQILAFNVVQHARGIIMDVSSDFDNVVSEAEPEPNWE